jgi:hypothetical protein
MKKALIVKQTKGRIRRAAALAATLFGVACALLATREARATSAEDSLTYFYSDSTYTTVVGRVRCICDGSCRYSGVQTPWDRTITSTPCTGGGLFETCYLVFAGQFIQVPCPVYGANAICSDDGGQTYHSCPF